MVQNYLAQKPDGILIGGSTGALSAFNEFFSTIKNLPVPILVAIHVPNDATSHFAQLIGKNDRTIPLAFSGQQLTTGLTLAPPGKNCELRKRNDDDLRILLKSPTKGGLSPCIDSFLMSGAKVFRYPVAVILSGHGDDGQNAARHYHKEQLPVLIQKPTTALQPEMTVNASLALPDAPLMSVRQIAQTLHQAFN